MTKCQECVRISQIEWGFYYDYDPEVAYQNVYRAHSSWEPVEARCGGVSTNGADPKCCEVHMQPWGHKKLHAH